MVSNLAVAIRRGTVGRRLPTTALISTSETVYIKSFLSLHKDNSLLEPEKIFLGLSGWSSRNLT